MLAFLRVRECACTGGTGQSDPLRSDLCQSMGTFFSVPLLGTPPPAGFSPSSPTNSPATPWHQISFSQLGLEDICAPPRPLTLPRPQLGSQAWGLLGAEVSAEPDVSTWSGRPDRPCRALGPRKEPQGPWKGWERLSGPDFGPPVPLRVDHLPGPPSPPPPAEAVSGESRQEPGVRWGRCWAGATECLSCQSCLRRARGLEDGGLVCNGDGASIQGGRNLGDDDGDGCAPV